MKTLLIPIFAILLSVNAFAQKLNKEKLKALKIAHITNQLDLTEKEAQTFWPIYNANEDEREKSREEASTKLRKVKIEDFTEEEAKAHLDVIQNMEEAKFKLQKEYRVKLSKVISSKKILKLFYAERTFRQKMIKTFKERHKSERPKKRQ